MKTSHKSVVCWMVLAACSTNLALGQTRPPPSSGADVIVGDIPNISNNTPAAGDTGFDSFAIGTTSCNKGDVKLLWFSSTNQHPVIGQNLFRLHNGRFEHIGQAWLKHGFTALQGNVCTTATDFPYTSCTNAGAGGTLLGLGCSDPYDSGLNNGQGGLGPKWQVNAAKGVFAYPFDSPSFTGNVARRLKVRVSDLNPATYPGARYFVEGQYVVPDDAGYANGANSVSYREVSITAVAGSPTPPVDFNMALLASAIQREKAAVLAWQAVDATVQTATANIVNDGRFILACKVTGPTAGLYTYEYALQNINSDRCAGSFSVPYPNGTSISAVGFHDVDYHSGERNDSPSNPALDDWTSATGATSVTWSGAAYSGTPATYTISGANTTDFTQSFRTSAWAAGTGNDHTANVLRFGTLYNFRFQTSVAPAAGQVQIGLWRTGTPTSFTLPIQTPGGATIGTASTGPCCNGTACTVTTLSGCTGVFGAIGATCTPNPCTGAPTGSCCIAGACTVTVQTACAGTWSSGGVCTPNPCPPAGTCCISGACTFVAQAQCTGAWTTGGSCTPNPCPTPTGACCNGANCTVVTQAACTGTYLGDSVACTAGICASNDLCANAIALCDGQSFTGNNTGAGTEGSANCVTTSTGDVWFKYTPTTSGAISIATNSVAGSSLTDTVLSVYSACGGTQLACDDDTGPGNFSLVSGFSATAGTTYIIRVASWNNTARGQFTITVTGGSGCPTVTGSCCVSGACSVTVSTACTGQWTSGGTCSPNPCAQPSGACCFNGACTVTTQAGCTAGAWTTGGNCSPSLCPPLNDSCDNRPGIGLGATPFTTVNATTDGIAHNPTCLFFGNDTITNDVWFNFPCTFNGQLRIDTCGSTFDTKIAVYDGYGCLNYATRLIACDDDNPTQCGAGSTQSSVTINVISGGFYTIRVGGYNGATGTGALNLTNVTSGACCVGTSCSVGLQTACTGTFKGSGSACGVAGNPTTCCPANFNGVNGISVQDIFDFLAAWFANAPSADFNGVNGITVQDLFDFLAAWFAGCP